MDTINHNIWRKIFSKTAWGILLVALSLTLSPVFAQGEVTVHVPVSGRFVRDTYSGQLNSELGLVNIISATWTAIDAQYINRSDPIWSLDGQSIAYSIVGLHSIIRQVDSGIQSFTTETVTGSITPYDLNYVRGWANNSNSLMIEYAQIIDAFTSNIVLYDVNINTNMLQEVRRWQTNTPVLDMPLPPNATSVQLMGGRNIEQNPMFDDWLLMQFRGDGYYSTFDIDESVRADINVLWNFRTNEYISLDAIVPDLSISNDQQDWSHDGTHLLLSARGRDGQYDYILMFNFNPEKGVTLVERIIIVERIPEHWLDSGNIFFSRVQIYEGGASYVLGEAVDGEYREIPFFDLNGDAFSYDSRGDWYMDADQAERNRLSCIFEWSLPTRLAMGDIAQVTQDDGLGLRLRAEPDRSSEQVGSLDDGETVTISGEPACSGGYRWWFITTSEGLTGWVAEANREEYFLELPLLVSTPTSVPTATFTPTPIPPTATPSATPIACTHNVTASSTSSLISAIVSANSASTPHPKSLSIGWRGT